MTESAATAFVSRKFRLESTSGFPIAGNVEFFATDEQKPCVLILHGFKGFKDWGFFPELARRIAAAGGIAIRFNFSLNGMEEGEDTVRYPERFAQNTVSQELADAEQVLQQLQRGQVRELCGSHWDGKRIFLFGHSRGGGVGLLLFARHPEIQRAALWASISRFNRFTERQKAFWRQHGAIEVKNARTGQVLQMSVRYLEDLESHRREYDLLQIMRSLDRPVLLVHGEQDLTVPLAEAQALYEAAPPGIARLYVVPKTGHTFGIAHPWDGTRPAFEEAVRVTLQWFGLA